jgi:hypothetical protein
MPPWIVHGFLARSRKRGGAVSRRCIAAFIAALYRARSIVRRDGGANGTAPPPVCPAIPGGGSGPTFPGARSIVGGASDRRKGGRGPAFPAVIGAWGPPFPRAIQGGRGHPRRHAWGRLRRHGRRPCHSWCSPDRTVRITRPALALLSPCSRPLPSSFSSFLEVRARDNCPERTRDSRTVAEKGALAHQSLRRACSS